MSDAPTSPPRTSWLTPRVRQNLSRFLAIAFVIGISVYIFSLGDRIEALQVYGYPGVFLFTLLTSATIILPAPGLLVVFSMATVINPVGVALAAATGAALGEVSGYLAGYSGRAVIEQTDTYERITTWMTENERKSGLMIGFLAFVPLPFMDLAGMAAGALRMSIWRFLGWCFFGKVLKMTVVVLLAVSSISIFNRFF
jgi:membrane protein YqaA with SNARE-associated domain